MDDHEWRDTTGVGDAYESQMDIRTGEQRHRPISMGRLRQMDGDYDAAAPELEWQRGPPPGRK